MIESLNTDSCSERERVDLWREVSAHMFVPLEVHALGEVPFHGELTAARLRDDATVSDIRTSPCLIERTPAMIRRSNPGYCKLEVQLSGTSVVEQSGRCATLRPGDLTLYDTRLPYRLRFPGSSRIAVLQLSREQLGMRASTLDSMLALRVPGAGGLGHVASTAFAALTDQLADVSGTAHDEIVVSVVALLRSALLDAVGRDEHGPGHDPAFVLRERIRSYIDTHLGEPSLCPRRIAEQQHISLRYLHKLFEDEETTVAELIRSRRLHRCRQDIADPALEHQSLSEIGARWGFPDPSTFSRAFRAAYGVSPREYRKSPQSCTPCGSGVHESASVPA